MQTRTMSLVESVTNIGVGFILAVFMQALFFPFFGIYASLDTELKIAGMFTIISIIRSYLIRRAFNG